MTISPNTLPTQIAASGFSLIISRSSLLLVSYEYSRIGGHINY